MCKTTQIKLLLMLFLIAPLYFIQSVYGNTGFEQEHVTGSPIVDAKTLRGMIVKRVGNLEKLRVPPRNEELPQPKLDDGITNDPRYLITEAKRYLGKQLYFDPVRSNRIKPEFGGIMSTVQTVSCGSCHLGEFAGRAGRIFNLGVGAEGRGYTDQIGRFHERRRILPGFVDTIPTGLKFVVNGTTIKDGRFDAVDSVPRLSLSMVGVAFNNRLGINGRAGQPAGDPFNPRGLPAAERQVEFTLDGHRMLETEKEALKLIPAYIRLFQNAFPDEAARYAATGNLDDLINDETITRAIATFLRTVVTRNTPWDRFLAGDDQALTPRQLRGALLFVTDASDGGANCISCHSGPMLNKQLGDEAGLLVEENFYNLGIGDHPLRELARQALENPNHHDLGRGEITGRPEDNFKFRSLSLRQLKDSGGQLMHSATFKSVREVVEYFNAGQPQDPTAIAAGNVTSRFTHPRGPGSAPGLGLNEADIFALVDFLENSLYDPDFVQFNPESTTDTFELNDRDLSYSANYPDLAALGAIDGLMISSLCRVGNDPLTRRDFGLEFLDVSLRLPVVSHRVINQFGNTQTHRLKMTNISDEPIDTHLLVCFKNLPQGAIVLSGEGQTNNIPSPGLQYQRVFLPEGTVEPGCSVEVIVKIFVPTRQAVKLDLELLSGQGRP